MNNEQTARFTATFRLGDPRGLHCRVSALLAFRLRVEAPDAKVILSVPEGRTANPKMPLETINIGARHSGVVKVEATGPDAAEALEVIRSVIEREPLSREEVVEAIPDDVGGDIGEIRTRQQRTIRWESWADLREQDEKDLSEWKSPAGWLYELADDTAPWVKAAGGIENVEPD
jgi:phosphotransferase system HPr (HPr) family protein